MIEPTDLPAESSDELTTAELDQLTVCEAVADEGLRTFVEVGTALAAIRDGKFYRQTHTTFADYLHDRFGIGKSQGYRMIDAAAVALSPIGDKITNEAQARELVPLLGNPDQMRAVIEQAERTHTKLTAAALRGSREVLQDQAFRARKRAIQERADQSGECEQAKPISPAPLRRPAPQQRVKEQPKVIDVPMYKQAFVVAYLVSTLKNLNGDNAVCQMAFDAEDALAACDQEWIDRARVTVEALLEYGRRLLAAIDDPDFRHRATHTPDERDDMARLRAEHPR